MKYIVLTQGKKAIVDEEDFDYLKNYKWNCGSRYHPASGKMKMHKEIAKRMFGKIKKGLLIDHANRNPLDNRRCNIRLCTPSQNCVNKVSKINKCGYRGVSKHRRMFEAKIQKDYKKIWIGLYKTAEEAALAYNKKAIQLFGEFAILNKV